MQGRELILAARAGETATVRTLLFTAGAQSLINYQDANGATPVYCAAENGHFSVTEQLIEARGNIDVQWKDGYTLSRSLSLYICVCLVLLPHSLPDNLPPSLLPSSFLFLSLSLSFSLSLSLSLCTFVSVLSCACF